VGITEREAGGTNQHFGTPRRTRRDVGRGLSAHLASQGYRFPKRE
jgi:hypothetical protein